MANTPNERSGSPDAANLHDLAPEDLFDMVRDYRNAPSNTASAMTGEQWAQAWAKEWQRANRAEAKLDELREVLDA